MSCKTFDIGFAPRGTSAAWPLRGVSLGLKVRERLFGPIISGDENCGMGQHLPRALSEPIGAGENLAILGISEKTIVKSSQI
jgi:hypothetical protein